MLRVNRTKKIVETVAFCVVINLRFKVKGNMSTTTEHLMERITIEIAES